MDVLELGGGSTPKYHPNLDVHRFETVDILGDVRIGLPFKSEGFDYVYSAHLIEHLYLSEGEPFLREIWRVLKWGGKTEIVCPDLEELVEQYRREGLTDRVAGAFCGGGSFVKEIITSPSTESRSWDVHHAVYDKKALRYWMERVGFKIIEVETKRYNSYGIPELRMVGVKQR